MSVQGWIIQQGSSATGTVTSVGLAAPNIFLVTGSPVTTAGTLTLALRTQGANTVWAGPSSGANAAPTFRALVAADIPDLSSLYALLAGANNFTADNIFSSTGYLQIPSGTTAQQPGSPAASMIRYNTTTGRFEFYTGAAWRNYVRLDGDTMTGDLTVPNVNVTTAVKLLDTTNKIALDVSGAGMIRIGNGFTDLACPNDVWIGSGKGVKDSNGVYLLKFPATVASATNYFIISNAVNNPTISQPDAAGTNVAGASSVYRSQNGTGAGAASYHAFVAPVEQSSGTTVQTAATVCRIGNQAGTVSTVGAIYLHGTAPSSSNYNILCNGVSNTLVLNAGATNIGFRVANTQYMSISATALTLITDMKLTTAGNGIYVKEGSNATMGIATMAAGTVVVNTSKVTASSRIFLTNNVNAGGLGSLSVSARTAGTSFTISSTNVLDTSQVAWIIIEPA